MTKFATRPRPVLDALDQRLLRELQRDCAQSAAELAERCGTTDSTAQRRRKRLIETGAVRRQVAIADPALAGWPLRMIVNIRIERKGPNDTADIIRKISRHPTVAEFHHVTGPTDYIAILRGRTMDDFEQFLGTVLGADARFATRSHVVIRTLTDRHEMPG